MTWQLHQTMQTRRDDGKYPDNQICANDTQTKFVRQQALVWPTWLPQPIAKMNAACDRYMWSVYVIGICGRHMLPPSVIGIWLISQVRPAYANRICGTALIRTNIGYIDTQFCMFLLHHWAPWQHSIELGTMHRCVSPYSWNSYTKHDPSSPTLNTKK